jgi:hypothetical protein
VVVVDEDNNPKDILNSITHGQKYGLENGMLE